MDPHVETRICLAIQQLESRATAWLVVAVAAAELDTDTREFRVPDCHSHDYDSMPSILGKVVAVDTASEWPCWPRGSN